MKLINKIFNKIISFVGMEVLLKKYVTSSEVLYENGKKITVLILDGAALLKAGVVNFHLSGGFYATVGNTIVVLDSVWANTSANDLGFFLNHEVGHLVLGHVDKAINAGSAGTVIEMDDEIAADNYARQKGFTTPDFRKLLSGVYGELATAGIITADKVADYVEETLEGHASRM